MHVGSSSPTRDRTRALCIGSSESYPLGHQGSPTSTLLCSHHTIFPRTLSSSQTETVPIRHPSPPPAPDSLHPTFCLYDSDSSGGLNMRGTSPYPVQPQHQHTGQSGWAIKAGPKASGQWWANCDANPGGAMRAGERPGWAHMEFSRERGGWEVTGGAGDGRWVGWCFRVRGPRRDTWL